MFVYRAPRPVARVERKKGMGLFDTFDLSQWGAVEWLAVAAGAYVIVSLTGDVKEVGRRVRRARRRRIEA